MFSVLRFALMEQHPVPQHIASYEFRLVGDMTLRQFAFLAGGIIVALVFYATPTPAYFKWPLILISSFLGFAFAFMPIEERPLNQWLWAFMKAVVAPTLFTWKKKSARPEILMLKGTIRPKKTTTAAPPDKKQLGEYLATLPVTPSKNNLDIYEEQYLKRVSLLFQTVQPGPMVRPSYTPTPSAYLKPDFKAPIQKPAVPQKPAVEAKTSQELPIPEPPNRPNILVGMVMSKNQEMIEGAIMEIRNSKGIPVRALKTNKIGQFQIVTPLENDHYEIEIEKEGFQFDIIKIEVKGEIIPPLEIKAK